MLINLDAESKTTTLLTRQHRGIVVANNDPEERGRVKCIIEGVFETSCPPDILPWVYPKTSQAYRPDLGSMLVPPVGSQIWIEFANGDVYHPMYTGAAGDGASASVGSYGSNIRPYEGATDSQSKEPEKYDADQKASRQGPTIAKVNHIEETNYGINTIPERQEGSSAEKTWGGSFSTVNDTATQSGDVNYYSFDRVNNTLDIALKSLGINLHVDNQGRAWINISKDLMVSIGGNVYYAIKGDVNSLIGGQVNNEYQKDVFQKFGGNLSRDGEKSFIDNVKGSALLKAKSREDDVEDHRTTASNKITRSAPEVSDTNDDPLEDSLGEGGQPYLADQKKNYDEKAAPEHTKRQTYVSEVSRGHDLASQAAGHAGATNANYGLERAKDLILSGGNNRMVGGLNATVPGGGAIGGILGGLLGQALSSLPGGAGQIISGLLSGQGGQAILTNVMSQALRKLGVNLDMLPLTPAALLNPELLQSTLASLGNPSAIGPILTSIIQQQLAERIPGLANVEQAISKVVDVLMVPNKLGALPDFQSPAGSLEQILIAPLNSKILNTINNLFAYDTGFFHQLASTGSTLSGTLKYQNPENGIAALGAQVQQLVGGYGISNVGQLVREVAPTFSAEQVSSVTSKITSQIGATPLASAVADTNHFSGILGSIIEPTTNSQPTASQLQGGVLQLVSNTTEKTETGEDGSLTDALTGTSVGVDSIADCTPRPQGAVGSPAEGYQYQDGPVGNEAGGGTGEDGMGDYSVPGGNMTDSDWGDIKNYQASDFQRAGMMDRNTVQALDRASTCYGSPIPFTSDGRTPETNSGAKASQHLHGKAIDINLAGMSVGQRQNVLDCTFKAGFSGFGFYKNSPNMLHVDTRPSGNTWYWGGTNGQVPDWAEPVWQKNGGTAAVVGRKPFGGRANGYQADPNSDYAGNGAGQTTGTDGPLPEGVGSRPINPPGTTSSSSREMQIEIVARTIWGEASNQSYLGKVAVGAVIANRVKDPRWPSTAANVCLQPAQFSCWNRGRGGFRSRLCNVTTVNSSFRECVAIAQKVVDGTIQDPTGGANHYHAKYVSPTWRWKMPRTCTIGAHIFYKA